MGPIEIFNKIPVNQRPDMSMADVTKSLFNNEFLSDVKFSFKGQVILSHSFELKKRSIVFHHHFPTTISTLYPAFHEVVRYIYTDECDVSTTDRIPMLKLAIKYKIPRLETKLLNDLPNCDPIELFEYGQLIHYDLMYTVMKEWIENELYAHLTCSKLETLHPDVLEIILKLDYIRNVTEDQLFILLIRWINYESFVHGIPMAQRRVKFDKFIKLIRFPAMTIDEFTNCVTHDMDIFSKQDIIVICNHIALGDSNADVCCFWNKTPRQNSVESHRIISVASRWETKFAVLTNIIMRGLRFGLCNTQSNFTIRITGKNMATQETEDLNFKFDQSMCTNCEMVVSLGQSIQLKPKFEYTVEVETSDGLVKVPNLQEGQRPKLQDEFLKSNQSQIIRLVESPNLLEIIYRQVDAKSPRISSV